MKTTTLFVPLLAAAFASAHGILADLTIGGKRFQGNFPRGQTKPSIIRQVSSPDPIKGAKNPAVNCGKDAARATLVGDASPGDKIGFDWRGADNSFWPHNTGPMLTYMASCGDSSCDDFDSTQAKWFKIAQVGRKSNGNWEQEDLMKGGVDTVTLPSNIAPGNYLIRHEIIALHLATSRGGAEFYAGCAQLKVGGNGNGTPRANELVSLPGAYNDDDKGIFAPNVFNSRVPYEFPGPAIASFVNGGSSGGGSGSDSGDSDSGSGSGNGGSTGTATYGAPRPTSTSSTSSDDNGPNGGSAEPSKCKLKKNTSKSVYAREAESTSTGSSLEVRHYPKHISRVMRNLAFGNSH